MHRYTKNDVREAFARYQYVTGDDQAYLQIWAPGDRFGTRYEIINARTNIGRVGIVCGAENAWALIHRYCDGWQAHEGGLSPKHA